jgi:hypothetical protein
VSSEKGATSPGLWHVAQFSYRIGAMSLLNVGAATATVLTNINKNFIYSPD